MLDLCLPRMLSRQVKAAAKAMKSPADFYEQLCNLHSVGENSVVFDLRREVVRDNGYWTVNEIRFAKSMKNISVSVFNLDTLTVLWISPDEMRRTLARRNGYSFVYKTFRSLHRACAGGRVKDKLKLSLNSHPNLAILEANRYGGNEKAEE